MIHTICSSFNRFALARTGLSLFLVLFGWYILTMSGHTYTSDEETMVAAGESLALHGTFALPADFLMNTSKGIDGNYYSRYGPGQSVAVVPFILVGKLVAAAAPRYAETFIVRLFIALLPALVTAATAVLLYDWVRMNNYSTHIALLVALLYATSMAMAYSRTFFAEPLATLCLVASAYGIRRIERRWWVIAGAAAGLSLTVKFQSLLSLPLLAGYAVLVSWRSTMRDTFAEIAQRTVAGIIGAAVPIGLLLLYNQQLYGIALTTGYGGISPAGLLSGDWREGLFGLLVSTGKGIFLFSPTIIMGIIGIGLRWRQQWREALLALALLIAHLVFYSQLLYWHGDGSWGARYMVFVLPFLYLPAASLLATIAEHRSRIGKLLVSLLAFITLAIQFLPVVVNFNTYIQLHDQYHRLFTPSLSPIVGHMNLWQERVSEWWLRVAPPNGIAVLRDGFSYSEGDRIVVGELFPRWTYAHAIVQLYPPQPNVPIAMRLVVGDHRPWPHERAIFSVLLNGEPFPALERTDTTGQHIVWELRGTIPATHAQREATITIASDTWNPENTTPDNPRDEDLGVRIETMEFVQDGTPLAVREALPLPTITRDRRELWLWYYDTPRHHLFDAWLWYVFVAGLPGFIVMLLLVLIALPAFAMLGYGACGIITSPDVLPSRYYYFSDAAK